MALLLIEDSNVFTLAHREYYETLDRFVANEDEFIAIVCRHLPRSWSYMRRGVWYHCRPAHANTPAQGWKIHLSATLANAAAMLVTTAGVLGERGVPFKCLVDRSLFRLLNSKSWSRGGAGKFITVYPRDEDECRSLLEALRSALVGFAGPYILSDRRFGDSTVVHYRYGGFSSRTQLNVRGEPVNVISGQDGADIADERLPYFQLPHGVLDPFAALTGEQENDGTATLKNGRYLIEAAVAFSNSGGVYFAWDTKTARKVVIKEARPHTSQSPRGAEAVSSLKKEYRLLVTLADTGIAPQPIDFFQDWEHYYLVEEFVEGVDLRSYHQTHLDLPLQRDPTPVAAQVNLDRYVAVYARVASALATLHARHIVFGDLSLNNVLIDAESGRITLIDLEGAFEHGVDVPPLLHTPGYAPPETVDDGDFQASRDCYALGALMLAGVMPINSFLALDAHGYEPLLRAAEQDLGFPAPVVDCIRGLLHPDRSRRATLDLALGCLRRSYTAGVPHVTPHEVDHADLQALVDDCVRYINEVADFSRDDRLFPAAPYVFRTNPLSLAYGATGIAHALRCVTGTVSPRIIEWILARPVTAQSYAPGLYVGVAGVSWALLELGLEEEAARSLRVADDHPLLQASPDLFYGMAGWGMAQLRFFLTTHEKEYLSGAKRAGAYLIQSCRREGGICWWENDGAVHSGLGHGSAGIALFLLYLARATDDARYLAVAHGAIEHVLRQATGTEANGTTWRVQENEPSVTPYWRWGAAGVGMVLLRFRQACGDTRYDQLLSDIARNVNQKFSVFPGQHLGLAGMGEFFLDLARFGDPTGLAEQGARTTLAGLLHYAVQRPEGVAFPGETRSRISCDLGTGSAGVARYIYRYLHRSGPSFMLDELLDAPLARERAESAMHTQSVS